MDFLPDLATFAAFTRAAFVLVVTPGPDMTLFLSRTLAQGRRAGLTVLAGTTTGCLLHTIAATTGASALLAASPAAFGALKVAGALYLGWLAVQALRGRGALNVRAAAAPVSLRRAYLNGLGVNLLNPKILLFFMTFLPQFVSAGDPAAWQKMLFLGVWFAVFSLPLMAGIILAADRFARVLRESPKVTRALDWAFAGVFGAFAAAILATSR